MGFIANECLDCRIKERTHGLLCKLDIEKTFDHVNRNFLYYLLGSCGFGIKRISWIRYYICTVYYSVLVNGASEGFGISTGDPLSHLLFVIVMEVLSCMLGATINEGFLARFLVRGVKYLNFYLLKTVHFFVSRTVMHI